MRRIESGREKRYLRGRKKLRGSKDSPRLLLYRGLRNMTAQLVDDIAGRTLLSVSTVDKEIRKKFKNSGNISAAKALGEILAIRAQKANIKRVKFDRSGYLYHGRVKEFAESCRKNGLEF